MKLLKEKFLNLDLILYVSFLFCSCNNIIIHRTTIWPKIKEINRLFHFVANKHEIEQFIIYGEKGQKLYYMDIRFNAWKYEVNDYNFSGIVDIRLFPVEERTVYPSLLQNRYDATRDWQTAGRFLYKELIGLANDYPSRFLCQDCYVRGMKIRIMINNIKINKLKKIISLDIQIKIKNHCKALSPIAVESYEN